MAKFAYLQNSFTSGEIDNKLDGRTDIANYKNGVDKMENFLPQYYGGATKRSGTQHIVDSSYVRQIPYTFSKNGSLTNYIVSFTTSASANSLIKAFPKTGGSALTNQIRGTSANNWFLLNNPNISIYEVDYTQVGNLLFLADKSGENQPLVCFINSASEFEIVPFLDINNYQYVGAGVHPALRIPYSPTNVDAIFLKPSATTGAITITAYSDSGATTLITDFFGALTSVGKYFRISDGTQEGVAIVTSYVSGSQVNATVLTPTLSGSGTTNLPTLGGAGTTDVWKESLWDAEYGYPKTVSGHEDRLYWGGTPAEPDHIWASQKENFFIMTGDRLSQDEGVSADVSGLRFFGAEKAIDSFGFFVLNKELNDIQWIYGGRSLLIGTSYGEFVADGGAEIMSRLNPPFIKNISRVGSSKVRPAAFGNGVVFVAQGGRRFREFAYSEENGSYVSRDISILSPDIASYKAMDIGTDWYDASVLDIAYDPNRHIVWAITNLGTLISVTYNKESQVVAWAKHNIGGDYTGTLPTLPSNSFQTALGFVPVVGLSVFPGDNSLYLTAVRDINNALANESFQIEKIGQEFENTSIISETEPPYFSDGAKVLYPDLYTGIVGFNDTDVVVATDTINFASHGLYSEDKIQLSLFGAAVSLPSPLAEATDYWVIKVDDDNYKLAASLADAQSGTAIDITTTGNDSTGSFRITLFTRRTWGGLTHIAGQPVSVLADGNVVEGITVSSTGTITFTQDYSHVVVGCPYTAELITKNLDAGYNYSTTLGAIKRIDRVIARFYKSYHAEINTLDTTDSAEYQDIEFLDSGAGMGSPLVLYTGEKEVYSRNDPDTEVRVGIRSSKPLPLTVTALTIRGQTNE